MWELVYLLFIVFLFHYCFWKDVCDNCEIPHQVKKNKKTKDLNQVKSIEFRFLDEGYTNWAKICLCFQMVKECLTDFTLKHAKELHKTLLKNVKAKCSICTCGEKEVRGIHSRKQRPKQKRCDECNAWLTAIERQAHTDSAFAWVNTKLCMVKSDAWELAKVFQPVGCKHHSGPVDADAVALLTYIERCEVFNGHINRDNVREVIEIRHKVFHSPTMKLDSDELSKYQNRITALLKDDDTELLERDQSLKQIEMICTKTKIIDKEEERNIFQDISRNIDEEQRALTENLEQDLSEEDRAETVKQIEQKKKESQALLSFLDLNTIAEPDLKAALMKTIASTEETLRNQEVERLTQEVQQRKESKPDKPRARNVTTDSIELTWERGADISLISHYQIRFKEVDNESRWKLLPNEYSDTTATISNLKADTKYVFQVRAVYDDDEGPYSETSDEILTLQSPATRLVQQSVRVRDEEPAVYALPLTESKQARNEQAKTRKIDIGPPTLLRVKEKNIMLVGARGTGKTTLVDGFVNYVLGVNWHDPFRFTIQQLGPEESDREGNQTEWITCYTIFPGQGGRLDYKLTIIDTPGFGDTRGLERDNETVDQIRQLFSAPDEKRVEFIDAVCFLSKAPDARLSTTQTYIFNTILSLYGNDIVDNIRALVTFADEKNPPVLAALKESNLPFVRHFTFNNSGLFANNTNLDTSSLSPMFWEMGLKSFREFFLDLRSMKSVSLTFTKEVLEERHKLDLTLLHLQPQVDAGLANLDALKRELKLIELYEEIESNQNFSYETEEVKQIKKELEPGVYSMNCLYCNFTCHASCTEADDNNKAKCVAMNSSGNCKVCPRRCRWNEHKNMRYIFEYETVKVKKSFAKNKAAVERKHTAEQNLQKMYNEFEVLLENIESLMCVVDQSNNRLKEIAFRPNALNMVEHIDDMIQAEKIEKKEGFMGRIKALQEYRKRATITVHVDRLNEEVRTIIKGNK